MERAILITRDKGLYEAAKGYEFIYYGTEFCQWLLPSLADLKKVSAFCKDNGKKLVLLTPWVTATGLDAIKELISGYLEDEESIEVVVNDLGVMKLVSEVFGEKARIIAGRLLSNQRRDPRTLDLKDAGNKYLDEHYQHSSFDYQPYIDFLGKFNVKRVEIDNLKQGVIIPADIVGVKFSVYYPYNYITVTRNCAFCYKGAGDAYKGAEPSKESDPWENKRNCAKRCIKTVLKLESDETEEPLFLKGTAIFIKNDELSLEENALVDRLIYTPAIPV